MSKQSLWLRFTLESAANFGRGDGVPGLIDREVTHDRYGCPYLHGRTLKGLLNEVCADILFALGASAINANRWRLAADRLFGVPGSTQQEQGKMYVGHAQLPSLLRQAIQHEVSSGKWTNVEVLESLTAVRRQTAIEANGAPDPHTLRSLRVILRQTTFEANLRCDDLTIDEQALLAACVKGFRRAGTARNRGRGLLSARLQDSDWTDLTDSWFEEFQKEVCA